jgi:hypothetical protein
VASNQALCQRLLLADLVDGLVAAVVTTVRLAVGLDGVDDGEDAEEALVRDGRGSAVVETLSTGVGVGASLCRTDSRKIRSAASRRGAGGWGGLGSMLEGCRSTTGYEMVSGSS